MDVNSLSYQAYGENTEISISCTPQAMNLMIKSPTFTKEILGKRQISTINQLGLKHLLCTLLHDAREWDRVNFRIRGPPSRRKRWKFVPKSSETNAIRVSTANQTLR